MSPRLHAHAPDDPLDRRRRWVLILGSIAAVLLLVLMGVGVYGLLRGPAPAPASRPAPGSALVAPARPAELPVTSDAEFFAEAAARALFAWDASGEFDPADYMQPLVDAGDESEQVALATDIRSYFPDEQAWGELRQVQATQRLTIQQIAVPDGWKTALAQARPGQLPEGAVAYTVDGTRHRTGTWRAEAGTDTRQVAFTLFLACPTDEGCRLLRLSAVDQPLR